MHQADATNCSCPVPVVRAIIEDDAGRVLLLQRANTAWGQGDWCLPGGKVDYGQTVEAALAREIGEETGLRLREAAFLFFQDSLPASPGAMHCLNFYFHCRVDGSLRLNDESSDQAWLGPDELAGYRIVFGNDEALRRYFTTAPRPAGTG
jgi:8-oxo-dGTP diphosphatase